ncbi:MAG: guanylate kinase [Planctomycetota bacterium]|nr:guanylate kinase [Planctomycetota bacterium]
MAKRGLLLIISGPSGVGKTTITHEVERRLGGVFSVSMTTRPRAAEDRHGLDYHFVTVKEFQAALDAGELLESAEVFGNFYGTPRRPVEDAIAAGRLMILEIDVQGAIHVKKKLPEAYAIFVLPPSEEVLIERLRRRKREDEATIQRRFGKAKREIALARKCGVYDAFLVNDELDAAIDEAVEIVQRKMRDGATG